MEEIKQFERTKHDASRWKVVLPLKNVSSGAEMAVFGYFSAIEATPCVMVPLKTYLEMGEPKSIEIVIHREAVSVRTP